MTAIQSFPVQQHASKSRINTNIVHFRGDKRLNRIFTWSGIFQLICFIIITFCLQLGLWLPLIYTYSTEVKEFLPSKINRTLTRDERLDRTYVKQCVLLPISIVLSIPVDIVRSYNSMRILITFLAIGSYVLMVMTFVTYKTKSYGSLENPYAWFCWYRQVLIYLVGWFLCHQLFIAFGCRPVTILYDFRYTSMVIMQIIGFFVCLLSAFFLGVKYALIKSSHRRIISSHIVANNLV